MSWDEFFTTFSRQCYTLADLILEWSGGGFFLPLLSKERRDGVEKNSFLWSEKRSSLRKRWSLPKSGGIFLESMRFQIDCVLA